MKKKSYDILFEDDDLIVVNKAAGLLTLPDRYDDKLPSLIQLLKKKFGDVFVIHRLDKDTSGVLCFAKNSETHKALNILFEKREIEKYYLAIVKGQVTAPNTISTGLARSNSKKAIMKVKKDGDLAVTHIVSSEIYGNWSIVTIKLETGKTHQIRVHMNHLGHPLIADPKYGDGKSLFISDIKRHKLSRKEEPVPLIYRTALHAQTLSFIHPTTLKEVRFEADLPKDFRATINQLGKWQK